MFRRPRLKAARKHLIQIALAGTVVVALMAGVLAYPAGWFDPLITTFFGNSFLGDDTRIYNDRSGYTRENARALYRAGLDAIRDGDSKKALSTFKMLEDVYPGLKDLILYHKADTYQKQPDEFAAQQNLKKLMRQAPESLLRPLAAYQLGQSHIRAKEYEKARQVFEQLSKEFPDSTYATGSLYYQGVIAAQPDATGNRPPAEETLRYWREYLTKSPDGRFSGDVASQLETLLPEPDANDARLIGIGFLNSGQSTEKAVKYLERAELPSAWLPLAKAYIQNGDKEHGVQTAVEGLPYAKSTEDAYAAIELIWKYTQRAETAAIFTTLQGEALPFGKDLLLWYLAEQNPAKSREYYRQLLNTYPTSQYAPESSWQLLWRDFQSSNFNDFLAGAERHLEKFPYAKSAPQVLFWQGKTREKLQQQHAAIESYTQLLNTYPTSYYAFRAYGRLSALNGNKQSRTKEDTAWKINPNRSNYPEQQPALGAPVDLPEPMSSKIAELAAIGATEDLELLLTEAGPSLSAATQSWLKAAGGDRAASIRIIRDALDKKTLAGNMEGQKPTASELKLLYPIYFPDAVTTGAEKNHLDPFLIQALMREESYFNELAVSSSNALGLMQLLPPTAREVAGWEQRPSFSPTDLFQPDINIQLGSRYLGFLHEFFDGNSMLAVGAYNGGPNAMKGWVRGSTLVHSDPDLFVENIPYLQTRYYIKKVFGSYWNYARLYGNDYPFETASTHE